MHGTSAADIACNLCSAHDAAPLFVKDGYRLVRCRRCDLAYIANPPGPDALARVYSAEAGYHDDLRMPESRAFAEMRAVARRHLDVVRRAADAPARLLDVGCSTGLFLNEAQAAGFEVCGVEFSPASAAFSRMHFGLDVVTGTIDDGDFARGDFDIVTMFDVIEHVPDPGETMRQVHAMLRPGGVFVVSTPDIDGLFPRASLPLARWLNYWPHPEPPGHLHQFSKATLRAILSKAGFEPGAVTDTNMALSYSFGAPETLMRSPKMLAYAALFAPLAKLGPLFGMGDWFYMVARKAD